MQAKVHFISGLPRSGSTLLGALLRQNPRFHAGVTSPVAMLCNTLLHSMSGATEFASCFSDDRRRAILRGVFQSYYGDMPANAVIFDTNRSWTGRLALVEELLPRARIVCCVREIGWIIDSIERLVRRNALQPSRLFNYKMAGSVYARVDTLMEPEKGLVGMAWSALREAWFSELAERLILVSYDSLARDPKSVLTRLYDALEEPAFAHDFENVQFDAPDYDEGLGLPGLHRVRRRVAAEPRATCLPADLFAKYADTAFWANPRLNVRGVLTL